MVLLLFGSFSIPGLGLYGALFVIVLIEEISDLFIGVVEVTFEELQE